MRNRLLLFAAPAAALAGLVSPVGAVGSPAPGPGCSTNRPAVAHHSGGVVVRGATGAPVPCETYTGFGGAETRVVVTADGTVVYEPATATRDWRGPVSPPVPPARARRRAWSRAGWLSPRTRVPTGAS